MYKPGRRNFNRLFDSKIAFSDSRSLRRIVGIASASRPCSVRTHHARVAPATRKREVLARSVFLLRDCPRMIRGGAVTSLATARANAVAVLRDLECGPVMCGHRRDQPSDNTGLAHAARMPTNHNDRHICTCGTGTLARALTRGSRGQECPRHTILSSLTLPTPPIVSNTPVSGAPASPRTQLPCRE